MIETQFRGDLASLQSAIPLARNISPASFELERERIFKRAWLFIGHTSDFPAEAGGGPAYFTRSLPTVNAHLLVLRGRDGKVRAFHNICRHRGNLLVRGPAGARAAITCGFHGWSWTPEGELAHITDENQFEGLDKTRLGLLAIACEVWNGFVFVNLDPAPRETLAEWLGELATGYEGYFESQEKIASHGTELKANWNLGVNSFTEGYHTLYIHRNTMPDYQGGRSNPQRHRPFMQFLKRHTRYSAPANPEHRLTPAEALAYRFGHKMLPAAPFENDKLPPGVNPSRAEHWLFDVIEWFPNTVLLYGQYWHMEISFWPLAADRTYVRQDMYAYKPRTLAERVSQEFFKTRAREVLCEDLNTLEAQQAALSTGVMAEAHLSRQESALRHHYRVAAQMMAEA
jgi:phenylpropionate dioxygenase-like ring-hydroxylating dioxygenase large terminal subunit